MSRAPIAKNAPYTIEITAKTGANNINNIAIVANDTYLTVAWYYNGKGQVMYYVNDAMLGTADASSTYFPDTELTVSFGVQNGDANARTMTVDYIFAAIER